MNQADQAVLKSEEQNSKWTKNERSYISFIFFRNISLFIFFVFSYFTAKNTMPLKEAYYLIIFAFVIVLFDVISKVLKIDINHEKK